MAKPDDIARVAVFLASGRLPIRYGPLTWSWTVELCQGGHKSQMMANFAVVARP
jgi:hypothetical protein